MNTYQISAVLAYDVNPNVKVYGGLRAQRLDAEAAVSFVDDYSVEADDKWGYGYLLGAAYERADIALRVALTYHSKISYDLDTTGVHQHDRARSTPRPTSTPRSRCSSTSRPASRRRRWSSATSAGSTGRTSRSTRRSTSRRPRGSLGEPRPLIAYQDDWWTYNLGVGRQLTDALAGSVAITWEPSVGGEMTSLGPYDGRTTGTVALTYEVNGFDITGGLTYGVLGDTENLLQTDFNDGSVWGAGLRVGYTF